MRVVVAQPQTGQSDEVRQALLGLGLECGPADCVSFDDLPVRLSREGADLILIRVNGDIQAPVAAVRQAFGLTSAPVLAVGPAKDAQQILQLSRAGAREYVEESRLVEDLQAALEKLQAAGSVKRGQGHVVAVASATPGSGVTTVAANVAFSWATKEPGKVGLIELGREAADVAWCLDLQPTHSVAEVINNWQRMDAALLRQCMVHHAEGVAVLAHSAESLVNQPLEPLAVRKLVILLRTMFAKTVLDLGHTFGEEHYEAMRLCDAVAVVARLDVPALRQARVLLRECLERGLSRDRIRLVANRYGQRGQLAWKQAQEALGASFFEYLPEDSGKLNLALNRGIPLVRSSPGARLSKRLANLAIQLNGGTPHK